MFKLKNLLAFMIIVGNLASHHCVFQYMFPKASPKAEIGSESKLLLSGHGKPVGKSVELSSWIATKNKQASKQKLFKELSNYLNLKPKTHKLVKKYFNEAASFNRQSFKLRKA